MTAPTDTTAKIVNAAVVLAERWAITPRWQDRLTPEARALIEAVIEHQRAETVTS